MYHFNSRAKCAFSLVLCVVIAITVAACGHGSLPGENSAGAANTTTAKVENLTPPQHIDPPSGDPAALLAKCQSMFSMSDADKEAAGVTPANCLWAQQEVAKYTNTSTGTDQPGTDAPGTTASTAAPTTAPPPSTDPSTTASTAPSTSDTTQAPVSTDTTAIPPTTTKPPDMSDTVALALMAQQMALQNDLHLGVGVTCDFNCVLLHGIQGQSDDQKAWSLLMKAVLSPVFLDDAARTVQGDTYSDTRAIGDMTKAADDLNIVMTFVNSAKVKTGVTPAGTAVYNTVVQDGAVVQFVYITTKDREWVEFEKDGRYIRFFTTCGNRNSEAPPGTPTTPNPPCHDDTPTPCTPPTTTPGGKQDSQNVLLNPDVPAQQRHGDSTVAPVPSSAVTPSTTPTGCNGPCPTAAPPPTSNPATTLPSSCSQEPGQPGCKPAPPPPTAPPSLVTTTTHTTMPPPPPSG